MKRAQSDVLALWLWFDQVDQEQRRALSWWQRRRRAVADLLLYHYGLTDEFPSLMRWFRNLWLCRSSER